MAMDRRIPAYRRMADGAAAVLAALDHAGGDADARCAALAIAAARELVRRPDPGFDERNVQRLAELILSTVKTERQLQQVGAIFEPAAGRA